MHLLRRLRLASVVVSGVALAGWLAGCDDSSSPGTGPDVGFDGGLGGFEAGGEDGAPPGEDSGGGDGAIDPGSFSTEPGIYLANLFGLPIDFCYRPPGETDFTGPVFEARAGVPDRAVGARAPVPVGSFVVLIPAGVPCDATPIFTGGSVTNEGTPLVALVVRGGTISDARKVVLQPGQHVAGKDNVYYGRQGRDAAFVAGGGASTPLDDAAPTALEPGLSGAFELSVSEDTVTREGKTAAGVLLLLDAALPERDPLLCDLLAPVVDDLVACGDSVRAP